MNDYGIPARLVTGESIATGMHQPTVRIRNEHSHTLKDAWRLSSSTVEMTFSLDTMDASEARNIIQEIQRHAFEVGQEEALLRNATGLEGCNGD